ncbi:MAG: hypothetical protein ACYTGN_16200 [Planctomycetota bacterium]|jgi:hypothetical protein
MGSSDGARGMSTTGWVVILGLVIAIVVGVVALGSWGLDVIAEQVKLDIQDHPLILEHIGSIETIELDFTASAAQDDENAFVFNLKGSKGNGLLIAELETTDADTEKVVAATLRVASGKVIDLFPAVEPATPAPATSD